MRKPVEQFMQEFFQERVQFNRKYYAIFSGIPILELEGERLEKIEDFGDWARVFTRIDGNGGSQYVRHRYKLRPEGETWLIECMAYQCGRCRGTGKNRETGEPCVKCKGEGWV